MASLTNFFGVQHRIRNKESEMGTARNRRAPAKKLPAKRHGHFKQARAVSRQTRAALNAAAVFLVLFVVPAWAAAEEVSFTRDIKPIFDEKCVACHACYDAPGQLDLRSV